MTSSTRTDDWAFSFKDDGEEGKPWTPCRFAIEYFLHLFFKNKIENNYVYKEAQENGVGTWSQILDMMFYGLSEFGPRQGGCDDVLAVKVFFFLDFAAIMIKQARSISIDDSDLSGDLATEMETVRAEFPKVIIEEANDLATLIDQSRKEVNLQGSKPFNGKFIDVASVRTEVLNTPHESDPNKLLYFKQLLLKAMGYEHDLNECPDWPAYASEQLGYIRLGDQERFDDLFWNMAKFYCHFAPTIMGVVSKIKNFEEIWDIDECLHEANRSAVRFQLEIAGSDFDEYYEYVLQRFLHVELEENITITKNSTTVTATFLSLTEKRMHKVYTKLQQCLSHRNIFNEELQSFVNEKKLHKKNRSGEKEPISLKTPIFLNWVVEEPNNRGLPKAFGFPLAVFFLIKYRNTNLLAEKPLEELGNQHIKEYRMQTSTNLFLSDMGYRINDLDAQEDTATLDFLNRAALFKPKYQKHAGDVGAKVIKPLIDNLRKKLDELAKTAETTPSATAPTGPNLNKVQGIRRNAAYHTDSKSKERRRGIMRGIRRKVALKRMVRRKVALKRLEDIVLKPKLLPADAARDVVPPQQKRAKMIGVVTLTAVAALLAASNMATATKRKEASTARLALPAPSTFGDEGVTIALSVQFADALWVDHLQNAKDLYNNTNSPITEEELNNSTFCLVEEVPKLLEPIRDTNKTITVKAPEKPSDQPNEPSPHGLFYLGEQYRNKDDQYGSFEKNSFMNWMFYDNLWTTLSKKAEAGSQKQKPKAKWEQSSRLRRAVENKQTVDSVASTFSKPFSKPFLTRAEGMLYQLQNIRNQR